jgi:uncharacterized protein (DUF305 family)
MIRQRALVLLTAATAVFAAGPMLAGCTSDTPAGAPAAGPGASSSPPPVRVVLPGRPGESAGITDSDRVRAPDGSAYNSIDVAFVQMMIAHHEQALTMAALAAGRAGDPRVAAVAQRIRAAQAPEIARLRAWLRERGLGDTDPRHDHATMPGMQDDTAMAALEAATGADFDRRFVTMMSAHHRGAVEMAGDVLGGGTDQGVSELANELAVEQGSEIRRMADLGVS